MYTGIDKGYLIDPSGNPFRQVLQAGNHFALATVHNASHSAIPSQSTTQSRHDSAVDNTAVDKQRRHTAVDTPSIQQEEGQD